MEDATGRVCEPGDGTIDAQGTCPEGHSCDCTRVCDPVYDDPCNGSYSYRSEPLAFSHTSGSTPTSWTGLIDVTWGDACGQGCNTSGTSAHLVVIVIFLLGGIVPWLVSRKFRERRTR